MLDLLLYPIAIQAGLFAARVSASSETVTGPVEFVWPEQRAWYAAWQTNSPCGTNDGTVGNRTEFPLDSGKVSVAVAGDTWNLMVRIAYTDEPTTESDFTTQVGQTVTEIVAGHQCYTIADTPLGIEAGTNATVQLEYTSTYNGSKNQTFYACADITLVEDSDFSTSVSCFNISISDPSADGVATSTASLTASSSTPSFSSSSTLSSSSSAVSSQSASTSSLSSADKAGIAVGCIIGVLALLAAGTFAWMHKHRYQHSRFYSGANHLGSASSLRNLKQSLSTSGAAPKQPEQ